MQLSDGRRAEVRQHSMSVCPETPPQMCVLGPCLGMLCQNTLLGGLTFETTPWVGKGGDAYSCQYSGPRNYFFPTVR